LDSNGKKIKKNVKLIFKVSLVPYRYRAKGKNVPKPGKKKNKRKTLTIGADELSEALILSPELREFVRKKLTEIDEEIENQEEEDVEEQEEELEDQVDEDDTISLQNDDQ
jgi:hypothetical protein